MENIHAGVERVNINPPIGIKRPGMRLYSDPIQSIESDLTATALVLHCNDTKIAILACDLAFIPIQVDKILRENIAQIIILFMAPANCADCEFFSKQLSIKSA